MKRKFGLILSLILLTGVLLAGCSSNNSGDNGDSGGKTTLNAIYMKQAGYSEEDINSITKQFEKENPDIKVNLTFVAYESLKQKILTSAKAGSYDVVLVDQPWVAQFAEADTVKDISGKLSDKAKSDIFKPVLDATTYNDKLYSMPWLNDTKYLFYNKKMLKEAGFDNPPKTWKELVNQAEVIKEKGIVEHPMAWSWSQAEALVCDVASVFNAYDGQMVDKNGNPTMTSENNLKALKFMSQSVKSEVTNPNSTDSLEDDVLKTFSSGKAAFALNWTYMYNQANDPENSQVAGDVGIALSPGTENVKSASVNGGSGLSITSGSKHPDEAWKYIQYMSSKDVQKNYSKNALPIWKSLYDNEKVVKTNPDVVKVAKEQYKYLVSRPKVPWYGEFSQAIQVETQKVLLGEKSPENGLADIQKQAKEIAGNK